MSDTANVCSATAVGWEELAVLFIQPATIGLILRRGRADRTHDEHDFTLDYIVTPEEVISCGPAYCPPGLVWPTLGEKQIAAIPVLVAMADKR